MTREKGSLPRAYLRIDPNLDQVHEAPFEMLKLILAANRQTRRGRFKNRTALINAIGSGVAKRAIERGDVVDHRTPIDCRGAPDSYRLCPSGPHLYVDGWDEWQESDLEVGARMRRLRARRRRNRVTGEGEGNERNDVTTDTISEPDTPAVTAASLVTTGDRRQATGVLVPQSVSSTYLAKTGGEDAVRSRERDAGLHHVGGTVGKALAAIRPETAT